MDPLDVLPTSEPERAKNEVELLGDPTSFQDHVDKELFKRYGGADEDVLLRRQTGTRDLHSPRAADTWRPAGFFAEQQP